MCGSDAHRMIHDEILKPIYRLTFTLESPLDFGIFLKMYPIHEKTVTKERTIMEAAQSYGFLMIGCILQKFQKDSLV